MDKGSLICGQDGNAVSDDAGASAPVGVLLINTGSPADCTPNAVAAYLRQFLMDPNIRPMPAPIWSFVLNAFIIPKRKIASAEKYAKIWTAQGSPLLALSRALASKLEVALNADQSNNNGEGGECAPDGFFEGGTVDACTLGLGEFVAGLSFDAAAQTRGSASMPASDRAARPAPTLAAGAAASPSPSPKGRFLVRAAMMFGEPSIGGALLEFCAAGCERVLALPVYPQGAKSTSQAVFAALGRALERLSCAPQIIRVPEYYTNGIYIHALASSALQAGFGAEGDVLIMAFHSIPIADVSAGDTYAAAVCATCRAIEIALRANVNVSPDVQFKTGYLSRFRDGRKWTSPFVADIARELTCESGVRRIFVMAPNFAIDNLETLYDINIELRAQIEPTHPMVYIPCLNDTSAQVALLKSVILHMA